MKWEDWKETKPGLWNLSGEDVVLEARTYRWVIYRDEALLAAGDVSDDLALAKFRAVLALRALTGLEVLDSPVHLGPGPGGDLRAPAPPPYSDLVVALARLARFAAFEGAKIGHPVGRELFNESIKCLVLAAKAEALCLEEPTHDIG